MTVQASIFLTPEARVEAHDGYGAPYLTIYPDGGYTGSVVVHLGHSAHADELDHAWAQLDELDSAIRKARQLIAATRRAAAEAPDEPTDEPTDEPVRREPTMATTGHLGMIGRGTGDPLAAGDHFRYPDSDE